jgi:SAM-dependent methyltransferase
MYNRMLNFSDIADMKSYIKDREYDVRYPHELWHKDDAILKWVSILKTVEFFNIKNSKIVDLGCGDSKPPIILKDMGNEITGFDIDPRANKIEGINLIIGDALDVLKDMDDNSVDVFYDSCSVTHFYGGYSTDDVLNVAWDRISKEAKRILKPGGLFILASDCRMEDASGEYISPNQIIGILENNGLKLTGEFKNDSNDPYKARYAGPVSELSNVELYIVSLSFRK